MSVPFAVALQGYESFVQSRGRATRDQINDHLATSGIGPISLRTYSHYKKLMSRGYTKYIPINRLDVLETLGLAPIAADRRSYGRMVASADIQVSDDARGWLTARLIDESLVGFGAAMAANVRWKPGTPVLVRKAEYEDIPCILVWRRRIENQPRLGLRALQFVATYRRSPVREHISRPTAILRMTHTSDEQLTWHEFYRILGQLNKLVESAALLLDTLARSVGVELHLASSMLKSIALGSPGDIQIKVDFGVGEILNVLSDLRFWGQDKRKRDLENANLQIEVARNAVKLGTEARSAGVPPEVTRALLSSCMHTLGVARLPDDLFSTNSLESGIVREQLLPAAAELKAGDNPDIEIAVDDPSSGAR